MKRLLILVTSIFLGACATAPKTEPYLAHAFDPGPAASAAPAANPVSKVPRAPSEKAPFRHGYDMAQLQGQLGLARDAKDLGFAEKSFNGCRMGVKGDDGKCGNRFLSVVNFRLVCRDSEETIQSMVTNTTPLVSDKIRWKLSGIEGVTKTDSDGYGSVQVVSAKPAHGQRLVLIVGKQFLGVDISQVRQIIVPNYWCNTSNTAAND